MSNIIEATTQSFDEIIAKHNLLVIDFWAEWCGPCKSFAKVVDEVAKQYPDVAFVKVDIESEKALAEEFNIRSVPSVMILRDNVIVYAGSGAMPASNLTDLLEKAKAIDPEELKKRVQEQGGDA